MNRGKAFALYLSEEFFPTFALPLFSNRSGQVAYPEYIDGKIVGFEDFSASNGRTIDLPETTQLTANIGDSAIYAAVFSEKNFDLFTENEFKAVATKYASYMERYPFFSMEFFELVGDRASYLESAVNSALVLKRAGSYLLNVWLHSGNVDEATLVHILSKLNSDGAKKFDSPIARLTVSGPWHYICALREVMMGSGKSLAEGSLRFQFPRSVLDQVFADKIFLGAMEQLSYNEFCFRAKISFVHPKNISTAKTEYFDRFGAIDSLELLLSVDQKSQIISAMNEFEDNPLLDCEPGLQISRFIACTLFEHRKQILAEYEKAVAKDIMLARSDILVAIDERLNASSI